MKEKTDLTKFKKYKCVLLIDDLSMGNNDSYYLERRKKKHELYQEKNIKK